MSADEVKQYHAEIKDFNNRTCDLMAKLMNEYIPAPLAIKHNLAVGLRTIVAWTETMLRDSDKELLALQSAWPLYAQHGDKLEKKDDNLWRVDSMLGLDQVGISPWTIWSLLSPQARAEIWDAMLDMNVLALNINDFKPLASTVTVTKPKPPAVSSSAAGASGALGAVGTPGASLPLTKQPPIRATDEKKMSS